MSGEVSNEAPSSWNGWAKAGLVVGIIAVPAAVLLNIAGWILGIAAIVIGALCGQPKARAWSIGLGIAAIIVGIIVLVIAKS
jgi:hypothetical protein